MIFGMEGPWWGGKDPGSCEGLDGKQSLPTKEHAERARCQTMITQSQNSLSHQFCIQASTAAAHRWMVVVLMTIPYFLHGISSYPLPRFRSDTTDKAPPKGGFGGCCKVSVGREER